MEHAVAVEGLECYSSLGINLALCHWDNDANAKVSTAAKCMTHGKLVT